MFSTNTLPLFSYPENKNSGPFIRFFLKDSCVRGTAVRQLAFYFNHSFHFHLQQFVPACLGGHFTVP